MKWSFKTQHYNKALTNSALHMLYFKSCTYQNNLTIQCDKDIKTGMLLKYCSKHLIKLNIPTLISNYKSYHSPVFTTGMLNKYIISFQILT